MPDIYPAWGEGSAAIVPQIYNWAQTNYANQNANIGRRTAFDQQDIANQQNYWQAQRAIEHEDAQRQAQAESIARAQAEEAQNRAARAYQFDVSQRFKNKELEAYQKATGTAAAAKTLERAAADKSGAESALVTDLDKGLHPELPWDKIATIYGLPAERAKQLGQPIRDTYINRQVEALNNNLGNIVAKTPNGKVEWQDFSGLIPDSLRGKVEFNRMSHRYERADGPQGYFPSNAGEFSSSVPNAPIAAKSSGFFDNFGRKAAVSLLGAPAMAYQWMSDHRAAPATATTPTPAAAPTPAPMPPAASQPATPPPFHEGQRVFNKRDGRFYIVRGGVPVPE